MTAEQWALVERNFDQLSELPAAERDAQLAGISDVEVRLEVASLLQHSGDGETIALALSAVTSAVESNAIPERMLGPYRLVRRLGQGGQGTVFEAVRDDGTFRQKVAIKIIKWDVDSDVARDRFRQERQILAGLEHPNIARLLDGGETQEGSPWLALEFVDGEPINDYAAKLDRAGCLRLFLKMCEAVQYAHRNLIIHRDLKPANILVTPAGEPKLLDFGIAKLLDPGSSRVYLTVMALTPDYCSPEQVRGENISTATDVYSLGVILYQLLTGRKPYTLSAATAFEMDRVICVLPPDDPKLGDELDQILMMALRKEPERRYASVARFAEDVERYLEHRPVRARPDTLGYRASKYVRRNWAGIAGVAAVFLAIAGAAISALHSANLAQQRFDQLRQLAHSFVFDYNEDLSRIQGTTKVREKMVHTALDYLDNLSKSSGGDAGLQQELAAAYQKIAEAQGYPTMPNLGHQDQAIAGYRRAEAIHLGLVGHDEKHRRNTGAFYAEFSRLMLLTGNVAEAERLGHESIRYLEMAGRTGPAPASSADLTRAWCALGDVSESSNRAKLAYDQYRQCYAFAREAPRRDVGALRNEVSALERVGSSAVATGRFEEGLKAYGEEERLLQEMFREEPLNPFSRRSFSFLSQARAALYYDDQAPSLENASAALPYSRQYLEAAKQMLARDENDVSARTSYAIALFALSSRLKVSDPKAAVESARESVRLFDRLLADGKQGFLVKSRRARACRHLANALLAAGKAGEAVLAASEGVAGQAEVARHDAKDLQEQFMLSYARLALANAEDGVGAVDDAAEQLREAESCSKAAYLKHPEDLAAVYGYSRTLEALSEHNRKCGNAMEQKRWMAGAIRLWTSFPDQNGYVRQRVKTLSAL